MSRPKISLIGGGQVGGNIALLSAQKELGDIVIVDIPEAENFMKGKALDISQLLPHDGYDSKLSGTSNFEDIKDSDVVVITAGFPRQPGMDREDLLQKNLDIMTNVANQVKNFAPDAFVIVVSNPAGEDSSMIVLRRAANIIKTNEKSPNLAVLIQTQEADQVVIPR